MEVTHDNNRGWMAVLTLYSEYSRQDVHDIFSPDSHFTQSSGSWGLHGIVEIPNKKGDFVFFVTFGQQQSGHAFDEWITDEGVISWQSQPRQSFEDRKIQLFVHHDDRMNAIHLFLRTQRKVNYTYLGKLRYLAHDPVREKPVYMYWQLVDWPMPTEILRQINLHLQPGNIYRQGTSKIMGSVAQYNHGNTSFIWHGMLWQVNRQTLISQVRDWIVRGLPEEATRYKDWYVDIEGQRISSKWLFHLITGAGYNEFDAPLSREKLSKVGLTAIRLSSTEELDDKRKLNNNHINSNGMKPKERQLLFQNIAQRLSKEFPDTFGQVKYRFPERDNWFELHFPHLKGYYNLRLARQFDEYAYFFPGNKPSAELFAQEIAPNLTVLSDQMKYPVTFVPQYWQSWSRLGFETPSIQVSDYYEQDSVEIAYAHHLGLFVQATCNQLVAILSRRPVSQLAQKDRPSTGNLPQNQILAARLDSIRQVLAGSIATPSDEVLCDWVHYCYDFGLYKEGQMLFTLVASDQVNSWYYDRTKKLARLCTMKAAGKE